MSLDSWPSVPAEWICVRRATGFLGVAAVETAAIAPGLHELELTLSNRTLRRCLNRLDVPR